MRFIMRVAMPFGHRSLVLILPLFFRAAGCNSAFWATDNDLLLRLPGTERRSDQIEGILRPWERIERIAGKGKEGAKAPPDEKKILAFQLIEEYNRSQDPLVRRAALRALGQITENTAIPSALETLLSALHEENLGNRMAAADALGMYGSMVKSNEMKEVRLGILSVFSETYREAAFSSDAGNEKETNELKDFRLSLLRNAARMDDSPQLIEFLAEAMQDEPLDDGELRLAAMDALAKVTGKNYGADYELWSTYVAYRQGKRDRPPKEISGLRSALNLQDSALLK